MRCQYRVAASLLGFALIQFFERIEDPSGLAPTRSFIATEAIERKIAEVSQSQKGASELDTGSVGFHPGVGHRYWITHRLRSCMRGKWCELALLSGVKGAYNAQDQEKEIASFAGRA